MGRTGDRIMRALIGALDEAQLTEFEQLIDTEDVARMETFFVDAGVPVQRIVTDVMARFAAEYD